MANELAITCPDCKQKYQHLSATMRCKECSKKLPQPVAHINYIYKIVLPAVHGAPYTVNLKEHKE